MKNKFKFDFLKVIGMIALAAVIGIGLAGCPTEDDSGGGGGDIVPAELQGNWLRDTDGTEKYLVFTGSRWGTDSDSFTDAKDDAGWVITSVAAGKVEYQSEYYPHMDTKGSFNYAIAGTKLTISNSDHESHMSNGTYTKQP